MPRNGPTFWLWLSEVFNGRPNSRRKTADSLRVFALSCATPLSAIAFHISPSVESHAALCRDVSHTKDPLTLMATCDFLLGGELMLRWAIIFLIIAIVAAVFGFTGIAAGAAAIAKFLFGLFLLLCLIFFI